jgi:phospholipid N-methyltransferase
MPTSNPVTFFKRFIASPVSVGAILPSSAATARLMAEPIPKGGTVLEIGAGTGSLTHGILERIGDTSRLTSVELDPELANAFHKKFPTVRLLTEDAETILKRKASYDAIVSGIPFAIMTPAKRACMFDLIAKRLKPNGQFIAFQYSLSSLQELKDYFKSVRIRFSAFNVPPAVIYICSGVRGIEERFQ